MLDPPRALFTEGATIDAVDSVTMKGLTRPTRGARDGQGQATSREIPQGERDNPWATGVESAIQKQRLVRGGDCMSDSQNHCSRKGKDSTPCLRPCETCTRRDRTFRPPRRPPDDWRDQRCPWRRRIEEVRDRNVSMRPRWRAQDEAVVIIDEHSVRKPKKGSDDAAIGIIEAAEKGMSWTLSMNIGNECPSWSTSFYR